MDLHQIHMEDMFDPSWKSLNVTVKGRGHQGQISSPLKMYCNGLAANNVMQQKTRDHSVAAGGDGSAQHGCVRSMFGKTSLGLVYNYAVAVPCPCSPMVKPLGRHVQ